MFFLLVDFTVISMAACFLFEATFAVVAMEGCLFFEADFLLQAVLFWWLPCIPVPVPFHWNGSEIQLLERETKPCSTELIGKGTLSKHSSSPEGFVSNFITLKYV
jgi:hypothetical protein